MHVAARPHPAVTDRRFHSAHSAALLAALLGIRFLRSCSTPIIAKPY
jgi:hypothetical protein